MSLVNPTYCSQADIENRYRTDKLAELTGDAEGQTVNAVEVEKAIMDYASTMNAYLRLRFSDLNELVGHPLLNAMNVEGAWLKLKSWQPQGLSEEDKLAWDRLKKQLEWVSQGSLFLNAEQMESEKGKFSANPRLFGRARQFPDTTGKRFP